MTRPRRPAAAKARAKRPRVSAVRARELKSLKAELQRQGASRTARWNADPDDVQRSVARLVLGLVEFLRRLMERQAIRRMEAGTLTGGQVESLGVSLMKLEEAVREMAERFGIPPEELNLDLGPLGKLM